MKKKLDFYDINDVLKHLIKNNLDKIVERENGNFGFDKDELELLIEEDVFSERNRIASKKSLDIFSIDTYRTDRRNDKTLFRTIKVELSVENEEKILFIVYDSKNKKSDLNLSLNEFDSINIWDEKIKDFFKEILILKKNKKAVN